MTSDQKVRRSYRMWNQREVDEIIRTRCNFPDDRPMKAIGTALEILYESDKWGRSCTKCGMRFTPERPSAPPCPRCGGRSDAATGIWVDYVHACTSHAPVFAPRVDGDIEAGDLVGCPGMTDRSVLKLALLANMLELTYRRENGEKSVMGFRGAVLAGCSDNRTLIVLREHAEPIIITGSRMRFTAHGVER